ncbi:DUF2357 domain-containing protein [Metabacillus iocasae]|uniref:DUF2357 domain-containing protein n=1 Tax=Priestia iocasae TaxID=2291674 RepID=A0ABS2QXZ8_9BACI|nr:DUF2357 domain-containing protein [Metabacillus iocasae]MBM7704364.1 hypothetical protein [Metabacillus iocasae]
MDTRSNKRGFEVEFTQIFQDETKVPILVEDFVEDVQKWDDAVHSCAVIRENINVTMTFRSDDSHATCTMDGFDVLPKGTVQHDEQNVPYIKASTITLFEHHSKLKYYPYIPGVYRLSVDVSGKTYYSFVKVIANRLTEQQLKVMQHEVEETITGLALDTVRKQSVYQQMEGLNLDDSLFQSFRRLEARFGDVTAIVGDVSKRVRSSLKKEYRLQSIDTTSHVDEMAIHYRLKHPESTNYLKTRKNKIDYDLPENRLLKQIVNKWVNLLDEFIQQVEYNVNHLFRSKNEVFSSYTDATRRKVLLTELERYITRATKMKGMLNHLRASHWYKEISDQPQMSIPSAMYVDVRYNKLLNIHQTLCSQRRGVTLHESWKYQWKRTDQLYEIWAFLTVLNMFQFNGFTLSNGSSWLFDKEEQKNRDLFVVPTIPKGKIVEMTKGEVKIALFYDHAIPTEQADTDEGNEPIYTTCTHNTPDIRVDVFIKGIFIGTILMDAKYRRKDVIMDSNQQLMSYVDHVRSPYIFKRKRWEKIRPVHRVVVFYPDKKGEEEIEHLDDRSISLIPLTPALSNQQAALMLEKMMEELMIEAEEEIKQAVSTQV